MILIWLYNISIDVQIYLNLWSVCMKNISHLISTNKTRSQNEKYLETQYFFEHLIFGHIKRKTIHKIWFIGSLFCVFILTFLEPIWLISLSAFIELLLCIIVHLWAYPEYLESNVNRHYQCPLHWKFYLCTWMDQIS